MTDSGERSPPPGTPALRALLLGLLGGLALFGIPEERASETPVQVDLSMIAESSDAWDDVLARSTHGPLRARISGSSAPLVLEPPPHLRAQRPSALGVGRTAAIPEPATLTLRGPAGVVDTLRLGRDDGAFLLEPREAGPAVWTLTDLSTGEGLRSVPLEAEVGGWVEEPRPLRILALSGPPSWEVRLAMRALEEAGEEVEGWVHLGRDLWVGRGREPGPLPTSASDLAEYDLVMVFPGVEITGGLRDGLEAAVGQRGVGLLLAGGAGTDPGTAEWLSSRFEPRASTSMAEAPGSLSGPDASPDASYEDGDLPWRLPPEIPPLPARDVTSPLRLPPSGAERGWTAPVTLGALGAGRVGVLHLTETWRWRMEGDAVEGHRAFWRGMADWLSDGFSEDPAVEVLGGDIRTGEAARVRLLSREVDQVPLRIRVSREGGSWSHRLPPPVQVGSLYIQEVRIAFLEPEVHRIQALDETGEALGSGIGVVIRDSRAASPDPEGRLARIAAASPGGGVVLGELPQDPAPRPQPWPTFLFLILFGIAAGEWTLRRRAGRP